MPPLAAAIPAIAGAAAPATAAGTAGAMGAMGALGSGVGPGLAGAMGAMGAVPAATSMAGPAAAGLGSIFGKIGLNADTVSAAAQAYNALKPDSRVPQAQRGSVNPYQHKPMGGEGDKYAYLRALYGGRGR